MCSQTVTDLLATPTFGPTAAGETATTVGVVAAIEETKRTGGRFSAQRSEYSQRPGACSFGYTSEMTNTDSLLESGEPTNAGGGLFASSNLEEAPAVVATNVFIDVLSQPYIKDGKVDQAKLFSKDGVDRKIQRENLLLLNQFFVEQGIKDYFIDCGTLLGAVQESDLSDGDQKADITLCKKSLEQFNANVPKLAQLGFTCFSSSSAGMMMSLLRKGEHVDIYRQRRGGRKNKVLKNESTKVFIDELSLPYIKDGKVDRAKLFSKGAMDRGVQRENLLILNQFFVEQGIKDYFIDCGTLLGAVRESDLIDGDEDADISLCKKSVEQLKANIPKLAQLGFITFRSSSTARTAISLLRKGEYVDIYRLYDTEVIPFKTIQFPFLGTFFPVPEHYDEWLTEQYGDWRVPDPSGKSLWNWEKGMPSYSKRWGSA